MNGEQMAARPRRQGPSPYAGMFQPIARPRLSQEVRRQLLERISDGRLPAETHVFEADLARQLGVSRTPLHEAMVGLERDGLVESLGRRGWRIAALREEDARDIYPVLGTLSSLAVTLANSSVLGTLEELRELAGRIESSSGDPGARLALENEWHSLLLAQCPNRTLVEMVRSLAVRALRFELACVTRGWSRTGGEIPSATESLGRGDFKVAGRSLEIHWRDRGETVVGFVRETARKRPPGAPDEEEPEPISGAA